MSADGDTLRAAAHRLEAIAEKATANICPEWTYSAVRHIARNCDIECTHTGTDRVEVDEDGVSHWGWDRYDDSPWITAMGAQTAAPIAQMLHLAAIDADHDRGTSRLVRTALALVKSIGWPAEPEAGA